MPLLTTQGNVYSPFKKIPQQIALSKRRAREESDGKTIDIFRGEKKLRRKSELSKEQRDIQNSLERRRIMSLGKDGVMSRISNELYETFPVFIPTIGEEGTQMVLNGFLIIVADEGERLFWADNFRELTKGERDSLENDERWELETRHFNDFYKSNIARIYDGTVKDDKVTLDRQTLKQQQADVEREMWRQAVREREIEYEEEKRLDRERRNSDKARENLLFQYLESSPSVVGRSSTTQLLRSKRKKAPWIVKNTPEEDIVDENPYADEYEARMLL